MAKSKQRANERVEDDVAYDLEIQLGPDGELADVRLDGESRWPIWFKVEWKGNGQLSAKIAGNRLSTREGDRIRFVLADSGPASAQRDAPKAQAPL